MTDDLGVTLGEIADRLHAAGIPYMIVGSIAALVHGRARATMDVDIVIDPSPSTLQLFVDALPERDWYVSAEAAHDALRRRGQFNLIDHRTGWKIDLIVCKTRPFSRGELARRTAHEVFGRRIMVATVEDVIVSKLEWAGHGASARQLDDVRALVELAGAQLDLSYIETQIAALELEEVWQPLRPPGR